MNSENDLTIFFSSYIETLNLTKDKAKFFMNISDHAFVEITRLLPEINSGLKSLISDVSAVFSGLTESGWQNDDLAAANDVVAEIKNIPTKILEVMTSLQVQDQVQQCLEHTVSAIEITSNEIGLAGTDVEDDDMLSTLLFLSHIPVLLVSQLDNVHKKMNSAVTDLAKEFHGIYEILMPPLTMEALLAEEEEKSIVQILIMKLEEVSAAIGEKSLEQSASLEQAIKMLTAISMSDTLTTNANMLDQSAAATKTLEQPLAEILFLNSKLEKLEKEVVKIIDTSFNGDLSDIDCNSRLEKIINLFSTKDEIEVARSLFGWLDIEETGEEGDLTLF